GNYCKVSDWACSRYWVECIFCLYSCSRLRNPLGDRPCRCYGFWTYFYCINISRVKGKNNKCHPGQFKDGGRSGNWIIYRFLRISKFRYYCGRYRNISQYWKSDVVNSAFIYFWCRCFCCFINFKYPWWYLLWNDFNRSLWNCDRDHCTTIGVKWRCGKRA